MGNRVASLTDSAGVELPPAKFAVVSLEPLDGLCQSPLLGELVEEEDGGEEAGVAERPALGCT